MAFCCVAGGLTYAQQSDRPKASITINTDLVITWAQITNHDSGATVKGLGVDDFLLREEGKQQLISLVKESQSLSVVILVDGMTCIYPSDLDFHRSHEAFHRLGDDAEIALMAWDSDVVLMQGFTTDRSLIEDKIGNKVGFFRVLNPDAFNSGPYIVVRPERTPYRPGEAIYQAVKYLEKAGSRERRKIIIIISWATPPLIMADTHRQSAGIVTESLDKTGTTVYGLYLTEDGNRGFRNSDKRRSGGTIEQFVEHTGGSILIGKREEADSLLIKLVDLIRSSYTIGYYPEDSSFDGRFRRISVELSPHGKTKAGTVDIKTRTGYRALRVRERKE